MTLAQQRLHIVELDKAKRLKEAGRKYNESISHLFLIVGSFLLMLAIVFTR